MEAEKENTNEPEELFKNIDNIHPSLNNPYPIEVQAYKYLPPIKNLKVSSKLKSQLSFIVEQPIFPEIHRDCFWIVFVKSFTSDQSLFNYLSEHLSGLYVKILLLKIQHNFDKVLDIVPILIGHSIHHELWDNFVASQHKFQERFIIDCYKVIYSQLVGITVADAFVNATTRRYLGDYFMSYTKKNATPTVKKVDKRKAIYEQVRQVEGGEEFVKKLNSLFRPKTTYANLDDASVNNKVSLPVSDKGLASVIDSYMKDPPLEISVYDKDNPKLFNCVSLSPLLADQLGSDTKQIPYKVRHATPHKGERRLESVPTYITVLQHHCQEKKNSQVLEMRKKQRESQKGPSKVHGEEEFKIDIKDLGPNFRERFVKHYKVQPVDSINNK